MFKTNSGYNTIWGSTKIFEERCPLGYGPGCIDERIPRGGRAFMLRLKLVWPLPVFGTSIRRNSSELWPEFVEEISATLRRVKPNGSMTVLGDFNAHVFNDAWLWNSVISNGDADINDNRMFLLPLCCNNALCIMNAFFQHRDFHISRPNSGAEIR